jgi:hypothetical protein
VEWIGYWRGYESRTQLYRCPCALLPLLGTKQECQSLENGLCVCEWREEEVCVCVGTMAALTSSLASWEQDVDCSVNSLELKNGTFSIEGARLSPECCLASVLPPGTL